MDLQPRISYSPSIYRSTHSFHLRAAQNYRDDANRWLRIRYLRQISGIAIEGHRRTRKSCSSLSLSLLVQDNKSIGSRVADESLRFGGEYMGAHAFTHLRVRSRTNYEPYATRACAHACESRVLPRVMRVHLRALICAREIARSRWRFYRLSHIRIACVSVAKLQIEHLPSPRLRVRTVKS